MTGFYCRTQRFHKAFTLVEVMVAMLLGAFILNGILQVFIAAKQTYRVQGNLARLQENGRLAMDFISQDVRMAGYWGCIKKAPSTTGLKREDIYFYQFNTALQGFEAKTTPSATPAPAITPVTAWTPNLPISDAAFNLTSPDNVLEGSDILTVRRVNAPGLLVDKNASISTPLQLDSNSDKIIQAGFTQEAVDDGLVAIVTSCTEAGAFQVTDLSGSFIGHATSPAETGSGSRPAMPGNKSGNLPTALQGVKVHAVNSVNYYVATNRNKEKLLYRRTNAAPAEALVDGVEQMQILYGVDTNAIPSDLYSAPNYYVSADLVSDWQKVVSVRISLLVATFDDNMADHSLSYPRPFVDPNPQKPDRKIRRVFTSTIAIRNRLG
jgi:type IV pilus assembly protein PilW